LIADGNTGKMYVYRRKKRERDHTYSEENEETRFMGGKGKQTDLKEKPNIQERREWSGYRYICTCLIRTFQRGILA
jgi:hypothetical protein